MRKRHVLSARQVFPSAGAPLAAPAVPRRDFIVSRTYEPLSLGRLPTVSLKSKID